MRSVPAVSWVRHPKLACWLCKGFSSSIGNTGKVLEALRRRKTAGQPTQLFVWGKRGRYRGHEAGSILTVSFRLVACICQDLPRSPQSRRPPRGVSRCTRWLCCGKRNGERYRRIPVMNQHQRDISGTVRCLSTWSMACTLSSPFLPAFICHIEGSALHLSWKVLLTAVCWDILIPYHRRRIFTSARSLTHSISRSFAGERFFGAEIYMPMYLLSAQVVHRLD